jgi:hypothetical protein
MNRKEGRAEARPYRCVAGALAEETVKMKIFVMAMIAGGLLAGEARAEAAAFAGGGCGGFGE